MAKDTAGFVNIDYVVKQCLADIQDYSTTQYQRFLQFANLGFIDLNLFVLENIKVAYLPVNPNKTVNLPDDYIYYTKVGIEVNGKIWTLTLNDSQLMPRKTDDCGETIPPSVEITSQDPANNRLPDYGYYFASHYRNGQYVGEMFGLGGGFNTGYFRIDVEKRQITMNSEVPVDEIILEYKSTGISADGTDIIPRQAVQALRAYIHWQRIENNEKIAESKKARKQELYYIEYEKLQLLEGSFTIDEYLDSTYKVVTGTVRR